MHKSYRYKSINVWCMHRTLRACTSRATTTSKGDYYHTVTSLLSPIKHTWQNSSIFFLLFSATWCTSLRPKRTRPAHRETETHIEIDYMISLLITGSRLHTGSRLQILFPVCNSLQALSCLTTHNLIVQCYNEACIPTLSIIKFKLLRPEVHFVQLEKWSITAPTDTVLKA